MISFLVIANHPLLCSAAVEEAPRWRHVDVDEPAITDLTVIFTGDPVPDGYTKVR